MSEPTIQHDGWCPVGTPGIVAIAVMLATFMEVLDSSVVNVALPHIAGNLSASLDESTWVLTSYLVSNAIVLPATGWLSAVFGRKKFYMTCVVIFALSSVLCGLSPSLPFLVLFRIVQGLGGGALQPISQAIMLESFPTRRRGIGMAIYGIGVVFAPIIGPTLGGWITDNYSWRWIFYINLPISVLALAMTKIYVIDPPYLRRGVGKVDYAGLGFLAVGIGALQMVLDNGQRNDWFQTAWIAQLSLLSVVCLIALVIWELRTEHPIIDLHIFKVRNFAPGTILIFALGIVLYGSLVLLPEFVQTLLGYSAMQAGMVMSPGGFGTLVFMPVVGHLVGRRDARYMIMFGMAVLSGSLLMMSRYNLQISFWDAATPRIVMGVGLAFLFVPLSTVTFAYMPREEMGNATGLFNLFRNLGGSFGIAGVTTVLANRAQFHQARLAEHSSPYNPVFNQALTKADSEHESRRIEPIVRAKECYRYDLQTTVKQAMTLSFVDAFWLLAVIILILMPIVFIMRRPRDIRANHSGIRSSRG